jgi:hypothetical protein
MSTLVWDASQQGSWQLTQLIEVMKLEFRLWQGTASRNVAFREALAWHERRTVVRRSCSVDGESCRGPEVAKGARGPGGRGRRRARRGGGRGAVRAEVTVVAGARHRGGLDGGRRAGVGRR